MSGIHPPLPSLRASLGRRGASAGRYWAPAVFVLAGMTTLACLVLQSLREPTAAAGHYYSSGSASAASGREAEMMTALTFASPAGQAGAGNIRAAESEWQRQRAEALAIERINAEMMPLTPGVTPEQYMAGDDLGPDAAATPETRPDLEEGIAED